MHNPPSSNRSILIGAAWIALFALIAAWLVSCGMIYILLALEIGLVGPASMSGLEWTLVLGLGGATYVVAPLVLLLAAVALWQNRTPNRRDCVRVLNWYVRGTATLVALAALVVLVAIWTAN